MIRQLDREFIPWDIYSACVLAAYRSYDDAQCWAQDGCRGGILAARNLVYNTAGGKQPPSGRVAFRRTPTAVISLVDGFALLAAQGEPDFEELVAFLRVQCWSRLQCDAEIAAKLPFPIEWRSMTLRFIAPKKEFAQENVAVADDPGEVYDILARCFPDMKNRNDWMADLALRWRRGTAKSWTITADGAAVCTAGAIALTEDYAYLGAVGTLPEARGRGLAGRLLTHIAGEMAGREIWLSCREELRGFYESIGFERTGDRVTLQKESA